MLSTPRNSKTQNGIARGVRVDDDDDVERMATRSAFPPRCMGAIETTLCSTTR